MNSHEPLLQKAQQEISELEREVDRLKQSTTAKDKDFDVQKQHVQALEDEIAENKLLAEQHEHEYKKISNDPDRIRKQVRKLGK